MFVCIEREQMERMEAELQKNQEEMEQMKKNWEEQMKEQKAQMEVFTQITNTNDNKKLVEMRQRNVTNAVLLNTMFFFLTCDNLCWTL